MPNWQSDSTQGSISTGSLNSTSHTLHTPITFPSFTIATRSLGLLPSMACIAVTPLLVVGPVIWIEGGTEPTSVNRAVVKVGSPLLPQDVSPSASFQELAEL